jgi:prepilin-type N-terminal cleavage/methylation domain-containing protein
MTRYHTQKDQAFTIVELIVVITIIALLVAHDMTESKRIAQVFWTMRYQAAAPKLTMSMVGVASFAERYLSMNKYFTQAEIAFLDDNRDTMTAAYNMLADCIVQEV